MNQIEKPHVYQAYLLRLWRETDGGNWLFSLEDVFGERERWGFEDLNTLLKFLQDQIGVEEEQC